MTQKVWLNPKALAGAPYWIAAVVVGLVAVTYSSLFSGAIQLSTWLARTHPYVFATFSPLCFVLGTLVVIYFAPQAGGTGIPAVQSAITLPISTAAEEIEKFVSLKVALVVIVSSLLCTLGGGALGREGPMVQIAASLFYFIGRHFRDIWPFGEHRSWLIAGGAAGIAAAFQAPLAGIIFVIEELTQQHFKEFKTFVLSAVVIAGLIAQWLFGRYLFLGYAKVLHVPISSVVWAIGLGILCGIMAWLFGLVRTFSSRHATILFSHHRLYISLVCAMAMVGLALFVDYRSIGGGIRVVQELLFTPSNRADWSLIAVRFFGTIISHLSGCAGGFLGPSLALGAALGSKFATVFSYPEHNLIVLLGMAAFLGAITSAPFTALVIVMEMTDSHGAIFPLMVACLSSHLLERYLSRPKIK